MIEAGSALPNFTLNDQNDKPITPSDLNGKWCVLYFYPKDDTPGCTTEACDFTESIADFEGLNATIYGVSPDTVAKHQKFIAKHNLKVNLLADPEKELIQAMGAWVEKKMYGKTSMGVQRSTFLVNPDGNIAAAWPKVSVKGHVADVKEKLKELAS